MANNITIKPSGFDEPLAPQAFRHYADDFYSAYKSHASGARFSPARLFLLGRSIELAAKGLHLRQGKTADDLKRIGHDLGAACDPAILAAYGITITGSEQAELAKANAYYEVKGFEYFLFKLSGVPMGRSGPQMALEGWPDLPDEQVLEGLLNKLLLPKP
jgi:hypothetical protein